MTALTTTYRITRRIPIEDAGTLLHIDTGTMSSGNLANFVKDRKDYPGITATLAPTYGNPAPDLDPVTGEPLNGNQLEVTSPVTFYLFDHLGNTRVTFLADASDAISITYAADYYPYGKILREYNCNQNRFLSTHHERDRATGYDNRGARLYDSEIGRFLGVDPMAASFAPWSPYNYVLGNPIRLVDPDGKAPTFTGPGDKLTGAQVRTHFDSDATPTNYSISIYANQPVPGTSEVLDGLQFGHAFVGVTVTYDDNSTKTLYAGLYATEDANVNPALDVYRGEGVIKDDSGAKATASLSKEIDVDGFNNVVEFIATAADGATYDINSNNCTDFACGSYNAAGGSEISSPNRALKGSYPGFGDYDFGTAKMPGQLGQDIQQAGGTTTTSPQAPGGSSDSSSKSWKDFWKF